MNIKTQKLFTITFLGLLYSSLIGIISLIFLKLEHYLVHILWKEIPNKIPEYKFIYILFLLIIGSILLMYITKYSKNVPYTAHEVLQILSKKSSIPEYKIPENIITALIILILGAGVGPEATLLGIIIALSIWQADKLRYVYSNFQLFLSKKLSDKIKIIFSYKKFL